MTAYYNEHDPFAAAWLRELIAAGRIAPGDVDERSIVDVSASDLDGYTQCHFFAGIGGWSAALRLAGWPDDRPVWTGSCPCQPFSIAGKREGVNDERHLWPVFAALIQERRPHVIFGEQVASKDGLGWWDAVATELEDQDYAAAAADLCAAGVGAPHIRQRLYWVGVADGARLEGPPEPVHGKKRREVEGGGPRTAPSTSGGVGNANSQSVWRGRSEGDGATGNNQKSGGEWKRGGPDDGSNVATCGLADADCRGRRGLASARIREHESGDHPDGCIELWAPWVDVEWVYCDDPGGPRWRPIEPGTFPLADGIPRRVGRLRGYGNAIVPQVAAEFIGAVMEVPL